MGMQMVDDFFEMRPAKRVHVLQSLRKHVVSWSDASGLSRRLCGFIRVDGVYYWTEAIVPEYIWNQLLDRQDHQIGFQDNGVRMAIVKGSCRSPETVFAVAKLWLHMIVE